MIGDYKVTGLDLASGKDMSCETVFRTPGKLRKFFRRIGLDKSTWEYKLVSQRFF